MLSGYPAIAATISAPAIHFAHRSRRLTIRTVSQTLKAANATPQAGKKMLMPDRTQNRRSQEEQSGGTPSHSDQESLRRVGYIPGQQSRAEKRVSRHPFRGVSGGLWRLGSRGGKVRFTREMPVFSAHRGESLNCRPKILNLARMPVPPLSRPPA